MPKEISPKIIALTFGILVICFVAGFYIFAWTGPTASPPNNNVSLSLPGRAGAMFSYTINTNPAWAKRWYTGSCAQGMYWYCTGTQVASDADNPVSYTIFENDGSLATTTIQATCLLSSYPTAEGGSVSCTAGDFKVYPFNCNGLPGYILKNQIIPTSFHTAYGYTQNIILASCVKN